MTRLRGGCRALVVAVALLLPAGCVSLPEDGPVVQADPGTSSPEEPGVVIDPRPPQDGEAPGQVVKGFLDAMTATPIRTEIARQFLTEEAASSWDPELETITYDEAGIPRGNPRVSVTLTGADRLDSRGAWQGAVGLPEETLTFTMALQDGEYRIVDPPDALIVPSQWFEQRFRQVSLYFFDPSARIMVPEPVFVPRGDQLATSLVTALLRGPGEGLDKVADTFIPSGLSVDLSVVVSADGIADVALTGDAGRLSEQVVQLMVDQFAWTLRQDPSVRALRITVGDRPLEVANGDTVFSVQDGSAYSPSGAQATALLYGLRAGLLVSGPATALEPVAGPFGAQQYGLGAVSVDLAGATVAGVSEAGTALLLAPVDGDGDVRTVGGGWTDLLRPAWDFSGGLWLVDRTAAGARVSLVAADGSVREVDVPGVTGRDVRSFLVSRDGSRLVAALHRPSTDRIKVSRIRRDSDGGVLGATTAVDITDDSEGQEIRIKDLGWRSPTSVVELHRVAKGFFEISAVSVDGAPTGLDAFTSTLRGRVSELVTSPDSGDRLYAVSGSTLFDLSGSPNRPISLDALTQSLDYVG